MEQLKNRQFAGIDLARNSVRLSIFDEGQGEMTEEYFPLQPQEQKEYIIHGLDRIDKYMETNHLKWDDFQKVNFSLEDTTPEIRRLLAHSLDESFYRVHEINILTRFRAFVEYMFHQERTVWDRNTLLLDFSEGKLCYIFVEQIRRAKQKAYRAILKEIDTEEFDIRKDDAELDYNFSRMMKQFLVKNPAHIIYLTGQGFEGSWMKKTLNYLCAGRRVFLGQNLYANGACLLGLHEIPLMEEGLLLMQGPDMVQHTIGVITQEAGRTHYVPIVPIGKEWYNTVGSLDIIMDKSHKVEFFYHNSRENEIECSACEIRDLPDRPPKTTRLRIKVEFTSAAEGVILITDLGFGTMFPATGKVTIFPFKLIS